MHTIWIFCLFVTATFTAVACDDLEDFPLDSGSSDSDSGSDDSVSGDADPSSATSMADDEMSMDEDGVDKTPQSDDSANMADRKSDSMQRLVQSAMRKPGMKERLAQVVPIIKAMTPAQRLALAGMVMGKGQSQNLNNKVMNAQLLLPISQDIAAMLRNGQGSGDSDSSARAASSGYGSYHVPPNNRLRLPNTLIRRYPQRIPEQPGIRRPYSPPVTVFRQPSKVPESPPTVESPLDDCDLFGDNICLNVQAYPDLEIIESIEDTANSKAAFQALIKDPKYNISDSFDANIFIERRNDDNSEDAICQSKVTMSRPKKARSTSGQWKYVVNTDEYVQTVRLEKCTKPESRCSHVSTKFKSTCYQVYNYHRLLTWDQFSGLTMDIFKVPTCCSCHLKELNPLVPDNLDSHNSLSDDQHTQSSNTNQKKVVPYKRVQQTTNPPQYAVHETLPAKYPPVTRRPYKKNRTNTLLQSVLELFTATTSEPFSSRSNVHETMENNNNMLMSREKKVFSMTLTSLPPVPFKITTLPYINRLTTLSPTTESPDMYQTTKTNYNYHPIMEYFVSPQPSLSSDVHTQDVMKRKADYIPANNEFQSTSHGWTPMVEEFGPRNL